MDIDPRSLPDPTPGGSEPEKTQVPEPVVPGTPTPAPAQPGEKTDPNLLLKSLQEEREKRRLAEEKAKLLEQQLTSVPPLPEDIQSDEGRILSQQIQTQGQEIATLKHENAKKDLLIAHPEMRDKWQEFEDFRNLPENKGMNMNTAAKAFRIEMGIETGTPRKGLEQPTGGGHTPPSTGKMTADEVRNLRETDFKLYQKKLMAGEIKID